MTALSFFSFFYLIMQCRYFVCNNGWPALMGMYTSGHPPMLSSNCFLIMYLWLWRINCLTNHSVMDLLLIILAIQEMLTG